MLADTMMRGLLAPMQVVVEHCGANAPATQPALQAEASRIETAYRAAVERFVARIPPPTEQQLADGQADLPALTQEIGNRVRSAIRPLEPTSYCAWVVKNMQSQSLPDIDAKVGALYGQYMEHFHKKDSSIPSTTDR